MPRQGSRLHFYVTPAPSPLPELYQFISHSPIPRNAPRNQGHRHAPRTTHGDHRTLHRPTYLGEPESPNSPIPPPPHRTGNSVPVLPLSQPGPASVSSSFRIFASLASRPRPPRAVGLDRVTAAAEKADFFFSLERVRRAVIRRRTPGLWWFRFLSGKGGGIRGGRESGSGHRPRAPRDERLAMATMGAGKRSGEGRAPWLT